MKRKKPLARRAKLSYGVQKEAQCWVGRQVWVCRRKSGITQRELADLADLDVKTIHHIEVGRNSSIASLATVSAVLGVTMSELVPDYKLGEMND